MARAKPYARVLASPHRELYIYNHVATNPIRLVMLFINCSCKGLSLFPLRHGRNVTITSNPRKSEAHKQEKFFSLQTKRTIVVLGSSIPKKD